MIAARRCGWILGVLAVVNALAVSPAQANTYAVSTTAQFASAIAQANASPGVPDVIELAPATSYLPTSTVNINDDLTIQATLQADPAKPNFGKLAGSAVAPFPSDFLVVKAGVTATFKGVTITGGGGSGGFAGVNVFGSLVLEDSLVSGNGGPGVLVEPDATATIRNSTLSDGLDFGLIDQGTANVFNATIVNNAFGGIDSSNGVLNMTNTIVAKNGSDCTAFVTSSINSLDGDGSCGVGPLSNKDPQFDGGLLQHGGLTETYALKPASPAVNAGTNSPCPPADQRGAPRSDGKCDIGAYELQVVDTDPPVITVPADMTVEATGPSGAAVSYTVTVTDDVDPSPTLSCSPATGSTFPLGTTTVDCTATDASGKSSTKSFKVTVVDTTKPVFQNVPANIVTPATDPDGAVVTYTPPTATDAVSGATTVTCDPPAGTKFPKGFTTVTCSTTDGADNKNTVTFTVNVTEGPDVTGPTISVPQDMNVEATSPSGAAVTYTVTATDDRDPSPMLTCTPASGSTFAIGTTTVNCAATDASSNSTDASFKVTVEDKTAPAFENVPSDITVPATGPSGATFNYTPPTATDLVSGPASVTCDPAPGATFAIAVTTVTCTATDATDNTGTATFEVTVADKTAPALENVPSDITVPAAGPDGAVVDYTPPTATDAVDGPVPVTCSPPPGSTFPAGTTTTVTCTATDAAGNGAPAATFNVTVDDFDITAPQITTPGNLVREASGPSGTAVAYVVTASDPDDDASVDCFPASGSTFPIGVTIVECAAEDTHENISTATFKVTVQDTVAPAIRDLPGDISASAGDASGMVVTYATPTASDAVDGAVGASCTPASGTRFAVGNTSVTCTSRDKAGNRSTGTFTVKIAAPPVAAAASSATKPVSKDALQRPRLVELIEQVRASKAKPATRRALRRLLSRALSGGFGSPGGFTHGCKLLRQFATETRRARNRKQLDEGLAKAWLIAAKSIRSGADCASS